MKACKTISLILAAATVSTMMLASCAKTKDTKTEKTTSDTTAETTTVDGQMKIDGIVTGTPVETEATQETQETAAPVEQETEPKADIVGVMWQRDVDGAIEFLALGVNGTYTLNSPNKDIETGTYTIDESASTITITLADGTTKTVSYLLDSTKNSLTFDNVSYTRQTSETVDTNNIDNPIYTGN